MSRPFVTHTLMVLVSTLIALLLAELSFFLFLPAPRVVHARLPGVEYLPDKELGYRPIFNQKGFNAEGYLLPVHPASDEKASSTVLFLGDSVVFLRHFVEGLLHGVPGGAARIREVGVPGYDITQEVRYFLRYFGDDKIDTLFHIIHPNDLEGAPSLVDTETGSYLVNAEGRALPVPALLFRSSTLVRGGLGAWMARSAHLQTKRSLEALQELVAHTRKAGVDYRVILLSYFKPRALWTPEEKATVATLQQLLTELHIPFTFIGDSVERAIKQGIVPEFAPGDFWHPSRDLSRFVGKELRAMNYPG